MNILKKLIILSIGFISLSNVYAMNDDPLLIIIDVIHAYYKDCPKEITAPAVPGALKWVKEHIKSKPQAQKNISNVLFDICRKQDPDLGLAKLILMLGITPNVIDQENKRPPATPLGLAALYGNIKLAQLLLENNADIEIKFSLDSRTPLMQAALNGNIEMLTFLISQKAYVDATNNFGRTALIWASSYGHLDAIKLLLNAGANVHWIDGFGKTALKEAQESLLSEQKYKERYHQIIHLLEDAGATDNSSKRCWCNRVIF